MSYLGMPLTLRKPNRQDYVPLLEKVQKRIQGWQGKFLSRGGRIQLIKSVLGSLPIYLMTFFFLPKWVIGRIEQMWRNFLWGKMEGQGRGIHLLNWEQCCMPIKYGGVEIPNLAVRNTALLLRWWWKVYSGEENLWSVTVACLRRLHPQSAPKIWMANGSFFWNQLIRIKPLFHWSAIWKIGDGESVSYWYDSWGAPPLRSIKDGQQKPQKQAISVKEMLTRWPIVLSHPVDETPDFTQDADVLLWKWGCTGSYTSASIYKMIITGGREKWRYADLWRAFAPSKVKFFTFLLLQERILTHEVMIHRGMNCDTRCVLCQNCTIETGLHLFFECSYAKRVWELSGLHLHAGVTIQVTWDSSWMQYRHTVCESKRVWAARFMAVLWGVWRQRNAVIFRNERKPSWLLAQEVREEAQLWLKYCRMSGSAGNCVLN